MSESLEIFFIGFFLGFSFVCLRRFYHWLCERKEENQEPLPELAGTMRAHFIQMEHGEHYAVQEDGFFQGCQVERGDAIFCIHTPNSDNLIGCFLVDKYDGLDSKLDLS